MTHNKFYLRRAIEVLNSQGLNITHSFKGKNFKISKVTITKEYLQRHNILNHPKVCYEPKSFTITLDEDFILKKESKKKSRHFSKE